MEKFITGNCPECGSPVSLEFIKDNLFTQEMCAYCQEMFWFYQSIRQPVLLTDKEFRMSYVWDKLTGKIQRRPPLKLIKGGLEDE